ncbi:hypothetical protein, partial [Rickettsia sp. wb]
KSFPVIAQYLIYTSLNLTVPAEAVKCPILFCFEELALQNFRELVCSPIKYRLCVLAPRFTFQFSKSFEYVKLSKNSSIFSLERISSEWMLL